MNLAELRLDCARKQKKGLHFIIASIVIWVAILIVHRTALPVLTKNLMTFCCTAPLMPLAYLIAKLIHVDFQNKENPLTGLGILFSVNQMLYLLIAMWIYAAVPEKLVMVIAMIFGAHLLPYGWLYQSKSYMVCAVLIPLLSLIAGNAYEPYVLAAMMIAVELLFSISLAFEVRRVSAQTHA